ncbi:MAG: hypothetical protein ACOX7I_08905 [Oscillospiraceae bacterium]
MTPTEILHEIVEAEHQAQEIYNEALRRKEGFSAYLEAKREKLRKAYFEKADEAIEKARKELQASANEEIADLDRKLESDLDSARRAFAANKEKYVAQIFNMVVGRHAEIPK